MKKWTRREFVELNVALGLSALVTAQSRGGAGVPKVEPGYVRLSHTGELKMRGERLWHIMEKCRLCPRECGVNRLNGERGVCQATHELEIASHHPHHGEERPLSGSRGSGTIFFTHCNLRCVFCINWEVSQGGEGRRRSIRELARMKLEGRATFIGNLDPNGVLSFGSPQLVEDKTRELLECFSGNPRFILNAGCAIPPTAPPENIRSMIRAARQWNGPRA
ncbi:MAG: hypothetical protein HGA55_07515, partial [Methanoregulaceae archaeon]|nr:hypothetical protein [Methanoregulaceae archaeon]